jgi:hypothetical protein
MIVYRYAVEAIATEGQSDTGAYRRMIVNAYSPEQARAYAQRDFGSYATVCSVVTIGVHAIDY